MKVLMVCMGNICRSPTAEAALRRLLAEHGLDDRVEVDSAGIGSWHIGDPPDARMTAAAADAGLALDGAARTVRSEDFAAFDLVLAMDSENEADLRERAPDEAARAKIRRLREFESDPEGPDVPDPYHGGPEGFRRVVEIVQAGTAGVLTHVQRQLDGPTSGSQHGSP